MIEDDPHSILRDILAIFAGASVAGWAKLLWDEKPIPPRKIIGGIILSGFAGIIVWLLLADRMGSTHPLLLAGVALLAGIGGASTIDFLLGLLKKRVLGKSNEDKQ